MLSPKATGYNIPFSTSFFSEKVISFVLSVEEAHLQRWHGLKMAYWRFTLKSHIHLADSSVTISSLRACLGQNSFHARKEGLHNLSAVTLMSGCVLLSLTVAHDFLKLHNEQTLSWTSRQFRALKTDVERMHFFLNLSTAHSLLLLESSICKGVIRHYLHLLLWGRVLWCRCFPNGPIPFVFDLCVHRLSCEDIEQKLFLGRQSCWPHCLSIWIFTISKSFVIPASSTLRR